MIHCIWVLNKSGICLAQRNYTDKEIDKVLFGGFLSAIEKFAETISAKSIDSFTMGDTKILYEIGPQIILAISVDVSDNDTEIRRKMKEVREKFLERYQDKIDRFVDTQLFDAFEKEFDLILYVDWNFEYDRKIRKGELKD
ncbi:MAG: hypothetical protein ACTSRW_11180 [Candidatus Helarchaeota archaeon]